MKNDGVYDWINSTERFDSARLPKHCLNSSGQILEVLKHPAPAEYREMYKEGMVYYYYYFILINEFAPIRSYKI